MVSEDDTVFHGEFSDDWTVSGKVKHVRFSFIKSLKVDLLKAFKNLLSVYILKVVFLICALIVITKLQIIGMSLVITVEKSTSLDNLKLFKII